MFIQNLAKLNVFSHKKRKKRPEKFIFSFCLCFLICWKQKKTSIKGKSFGIFFCSLEHKKKKRLVFSGYQLFFFCVRKKSKKQLLGSEKKKNPFFCHSKEQSSRDKTEILNLYKAICCAQVSFPKLNVC